MTRQSVGITGLGTALPDRVVTNADLERMVETSDEWIRERTGIRERRIADPETASSDLAVRAAEEALADAGLGAEALDLIIVATVTPDMVMPSTACVVQERLGAMRAAAFDLNAACSGFVYALSVAADLVAAGGYRTVLVIGVDTMSRLVDWRDRSTCVLFGDGAGAAVVQPVEAGYGLLASYLGSDGAGSELLAVPAGGSRLPTSRRTVEEGLHYMKMEGREVYRFAVKTMGDAAERVLERCGLRFEDVDHYVPHQANLRIIEASARRFGLPMEKVVVNIDRYGNISAASIPVALCEADRAGRFRRGDIVLGVAVGSGLTWGAMVMRWCR